MKFCLYSVFVIQFILLLFFPCLPDFVRKTVKLVYALYLSPAAFGTSTNVPPFKAFFHTNLFQITYVSQWFNL